MTLESMKLLAAGLIGSAIKDYQKKGFEPKGREINKRKALIWIKDNNTNPFSLEWCCEILNISSWYIKKMFFKNIYKRRNKNEN